MRHGNSLDDLGGLDQPGLAPEPALPREIAGKDGLQLGLVPPAQRVLPCAPHGEHGQCARRGRRVGDGLHALRREGKPIEDVGPECQRVGCVAHRGEPRLPEELERHAPPESGQVEVHRLCEPGEIGDYENRLVLIAANEGQNLAILRRQELQAPSTEDLGALA